MLIVGFGAGVTAGSFVTYPGIQRIAICEIEPLIPPTATRYFGDQNYEVMRDPRTQIFYDDARHFILHHVGEVRHHHLRPDPSVGQGRATLYTKEYFELVRRHLNPGGIVTQWVPLYETSVAAVKSEIATFVAVFPGATIWANELAGGGYDVFLLGENTPAPVDIDAIDARLHSPAYQRVAQSLADVGVHSAVDLLGIYAGRAQDLAPWLQDAEINRDDNLRLQYLAGMAVNVHDRLGIFKAIVSYRHFPADLFVGSPERVRELAAAI